MSWRDIEDYNHSAINEDSDEAVAFFLNEDDCNKFIDAFNKDPDNGKLRLRKGEYIDLNVSVEVRGS